MDSYEVFNVSFHDFFSTFLVLLTFNQIATFYHNNEMFKQHKSKIKYSTDHWHLWTEPLPEPAASSPLWSLFDCLRISIRSQALQISVVAIRWKPDSACFVFLRAHPGEWRAQRPSVDNRLCRARRQKRRTNQRQTLRRAVWRIFCDRITMGSRRSSYIYTC